MRKSLVYLLLITLAQGALASGALGEYGFLTHFEAMPESEARQRIRDMVKLGVREFQFYDWFADYSTPTRGSCWTDPYFHRRQICLSTIQIYIDEIHQQHGRSWAYVQSVGSENAELADLNLGIFKLFDAQGAWHWHNGRFPTYFANAEWATEMVRTWAKPVAELGFDGIHWDTLGPIAGDYGAELQGFHAFLRASQKALLYQGLKQTANFVSLAWWSDEAAKTLVEFPYAELWSDREKSRYFRHLQGETLRGLAAVIVFYPSVERADNQTQSELMLQRWKEAKSHHLHYALIADGQNRITAEYIPATVPLTTEEILILSATEAK